MNRRLKRAIAFYLISGLVLVAPVIASIVVAIIGVSYWRWEGRAFLAIVAGLILSGSLLCLFFDFIDDYSKDVQAWIEEPEAEKTNPRAGAWKAKDV